MLNVSCLIAGHIAQRYVRAIEALAMQVHFASASCVDRQHLSSLNAAFMMNLATIYFCSIHQYLIYRKSTYDQQATACRMPQQVSVGVCCYYSLHTMMKRLCCKRAQHDLLCDSRFTAAIAVMGSLLTFTAV
eukprot:17820-Heterococcus_DN1.PRE.3